MRRIGYLFFILLGLFLVGCNKDEEISTKEAEKFIKDSFDGKEIVEDIFFPTSEESLNATFEWRVSQNDYLDNEGRLNRPQEDTIVLVEVLVTVQNETSKKEAIVTVNLTLKGWGNSFLEVEAWLKQEMEGFKEVEEDITLPLSYQNAQLKWISSNEKILTNAGKVYRNDIDVEVTLTCQMTLDNNKKEIEFKVIVKKAEHSFSEVENWLLANYDGITIDKNINLPKNLAEYQATLEWTIGESDYLDEDGNFTAPILDLESLIFVVITMNGRQEEIDLMVNLKGWGTKMDVIKEWIKSQVGGVISNSIRFPSTHNYYASQITWSSSNEERLSSTGLVNKDDYEDTKVTLTCEIIYQEEKEIMTIEVIVPKKSDAEKNYEVRDWLDSLFKDIDTINEDIELPTKYEKFEALISWETNSPGVISESGKYSVPLFDRVVQLVATSVIGDSKIRLTYEFNTYGEKEKDIWDAVNKILSYIALERITNQKYYTYGFQDDYKKNEVINLGYLPFYVNEGANPSVEILELTHGMNRTGIKKTSTEYIVIHDTGSAAPSANARSHANWLKSMTNDASSASYVSWHYTVDQDEIIQHLPLDEVGYHAGDGSHVYGDTYFNKDYNKWCIGGGNRNGIGIETCVNYGSDYNMTMRRTAKLVAELLIEFDLGLDRVKQHNDFSGKDCPMTMRHAERWQEIMTLIEIEYYGKTVLKDVTFKWTSLSPDIMDDTGKIINHPQEETKVNYKVEVSYNGEVKTFNFSSILNTLK